MELSRRSNSKRILSILGLSAFLIFIFVGIPFFLGFSKAGFSQQGVFNQYIIYSVTGIAFLIGLIILSFIEILIKEKDKKYGDGIGFANQGDFPSFKLFGKYSTFQIFLFSLIAITVLALVNYLTIQQTFFPVGVLPQQFTKTDNVIFSSFLVPAPENLGLAFFLALFLVVLRYYARKGNLSPQNFFIFALTGVLVISGIYGYGLHQIVYGHQETDLLRTVIIWEFGGLITLFVGTFVVFFNIHTVNNLFSPCSGTSCSSLASISSREITLVYIVVVLIVLTGIYWMLYLRKKTKFGGLT